jgi:hypothetical protein
MRCDDARPRLSVAMDEPLDPSEASALDAHVEGCTACTAFAAHLATLRRELRFERLAPADVPDVAPAVLDAVRRRRPPPWWSRVAAAFLGGALLGAAIIGVRVGPPTHVAAADLAARVLVAQHAVRSLDARVTIVERGYHPDVPERRFTGTLAYRAPESLAIRLTDRTTYPTGRWVPGDTALVIDGARAWATGPAPCPRALLPDCTPATPALWAADGREPFDPGVPVPLDLIVPVRSFAHGDPATALEARDVEGRLAVGVEVSAAQIAPLLDGLRRAGAWRAVHPTDRARLWLDAELLVPVAVAVVAGDDPDRQLWAARHAYADPPDIPFLEVTLADARINADVVADRFPPAPAHARTRDGGFRPGPATVHPGWLPEGMEAYRHGVAGESQQTRIGSWTDGRAWIVVRRAPRKASTPAEAARHVDLPRSGVAAVGDAGSRVTLHTGDEQVVVTGSVDEETLLRVADSLGLVGLPVTATFKQPADVRGLVPAEEISGFAPPEAEAGGQPDRIVLRYQGPGGRAFVLTQVRARQLSPPLGADVRGVQVRDTVGRYTPALSTLEWAEEGWVLSLRSDTLPLAELVGIAEQLGGA